MDNDSLIQASPRNSGFTLRDLLIVLCLFAVVGIVLAPSYFKARETRRGIACFSNERQLGLAFLQYTQDNNDAFPPGEGGAGWCGAVAPYAFSTGLFCCPSERQIAPTSTGTPPLGASILYTVSYGMNSNLGVRRKDPATPVPAFWLHPTATQSSLTNSEQTVLLFEVSNAASPINAFLSPSDNRSMAVCSPTGNLDRDVRDRFPTGCPADGGKHIYYATGSVDGRAVNDGLEADARHHGGSNFIACDGHGYWFRPDQVSGGANAATPNSPPTQIALPTGGQSYRARGTGVGGNMTFSTK